MLGETVLACNGDSLSSSSSSAFFFSAPASPTHFLLSSSPLHSAYSSIATSHLEQADFEFGLVARSMSTAEDLFFNGQIRPGFVSTDQTPLSYPEPVHRRTRSVSPKRSPLSLWRDQRKASAASLKMKPESEVELNPNMASETARSQHELESVSASTSRSSSSNSSSSSSSNANSRRWGFIKDLLSLQRSKSEGGMLAAEGAGSRLAPQTQSQRQRSSICTNGSGRMAHSSSFGPGLYKERHRRPETDSVKEMRRRMTFLPYKQQWFLFGCLGFSSSRLTRNAGIATVSARHS